MSFEISRGTSQVNWPTMRDKVDYSFDAEDIQACKDLGLDHLRLPLYERLMWDESGKQQSDRWDSLNQFLDLCEQGGIKAVIEIHEMHSHCCQEDGSRKLFSDPEAPKHFANLWAQLSKAVKSRSLDTVAYELLNEPVAEKNEDWNRAYKPAYDTLRMLEPERTLFLGSNRWSQCGTFPELEIPPNDTNLILVFHYYKPMPLTHYGVPFLTGFRDYKGPVHYPGYPLDKNDLGALSHEARERLLKENEECSFEIMKADIKVAVDVARKSGCRLTCNEFGFNSDAPEPLVERWLNDFVNILNEFEIPWATWCYQNSRFGMFDENKTLRPIWKRLLKGVFSY